MTELENHLFNLQIAVTLRTATAKDLPKLEWYGQYKHFRNLFRRTFREQNAGRRLILIADLNDFPIGHVFIQLKAAQQRRKRAYFYSFRVMDMFQGQGIGTWLLSNAEVMALDRGLEWATIAAAKENTGARRLYERLGYKIYGENNGSWSYVDHRGITREVNEACWLLEKKLELR